MAPIRLIAQAMLASSPSSPRVLFAAVNGLVPCLAIMTGALLAQGRMFAAPEAASQAQT
ncbi:Tellurite resistance protein TehA [Methylorubrum populi]|uniref:Tellurite resistance protein TehA n=1 Tax=Methylorubrum populi TaxID=223967 RepID=A0A833J7Z7_9HYPH|nr:Tellurite resistance protein TehA [Methylorubrum populi]